MFWNMNIKKTWSFRRENKILTCGVGFAVLFIYVLYPSIMMICKVIKICYAWCLSTFRKNIICKLIISIHVQLHIIFIIEVLYYTNVFCIILHYLYPCDISLWSENVGHQFDFDSSLVVCRIYRYRYVQNTYKIVNLMCIFCSTSSFYLNCFDPNMR